MCTIHYCTILPNITMLSQSSMLKYCYGTQNIKSYNKLMYLFPVVHIVNSELVIMMCAREDILPSEKLLFDYGPCYKESIGNCVPGCVKCQQS